MISDSSAHLYPSYRIGSQSTASAAISIYYISNIYISNTCVIFDFSLIKQCYFVTSASWFAFVYFSICLLALNAFYSVLFSCLLEFSKILITIDLYYYVYVFSLFSFLQFRVLYFISAFAQFTILHYSFLCVCRFCRKQPIITILNNLVFLFFFVFFLSFYFFYSCNLPTFNTTLNRVL